jgi:hypothetical protein
MTEAEWLACEDPQPMLEWLRNKASDRKLRLFAVACCRRIGHISDKRLRQAVEIAERRADGLATDADLARIYRECDNNNRYESEPVAFYLQLASLHLTSHSGLDVPDAGSAAYVVEHVPIDASDAVSSAAAREGGEAAGRAKCTAESLAQAWLLRDIIGNHFHLFAADPSWLTPTVTSLAQAIYADRAFDRLPILADALEDAGCTNQDMLAHCRGGGEHVRGCWVVDLLTGRE